MLMADLWPAGMNGHGSSPRDAESGEESDADEFCDTSDIPDEVSRYLMSFYQIFLKR